MKRSHPLQRRTPLKRNTPLMRSSEPIKKVSDKRKVTNAIYSEQTRQFKLEVRECQINLPGCTRRVEHNHHTRGRGLYFLSKKYRLAGCPHCHDEVHKNPQLAYSLGLMLKRNHANYIIDLQKFKLGIEID